MNANLYRWDKGRELKPRYSKGYVIVQKVRPAAKPSLLFGCMRHKVSYFYQEWETELLAHVHDKEAFRRNLAENIAVITHLIISVPDPMRCLATDFQVFLDPHGHMYHIDLDRCFENARVNNPRKARKDLKRTMSCFDELKLRLSQEGL